MLSFLLFPLLRDTLKLELDALLRLKKHILLMSSSLTQRIAVEDSRRCSH